MIYFSKVRILLHTTKQIVLSFLKKGNKGHCYCILNRMGGGYVVVLCCLYCVVFY